MDWQPIETAPKDGTAILIWQPSHERHDDKHRGGNYDDNRYAIGYWRTDQDPSRGCEWMWGNRNAAFVTPTHWMPLPAPPSSPANDKDKVDGRTDCRLLGVDRRASQRWALLGNAQHAGKRWAFERLTKGQSSRDWRG